MSETTDPKPAELIAETPKTAVADATVVLPVVEAPSIAPSAAPAEPIVAQVEPAKDPVASAPEEGPPAPKPADIVPAETAAVATADAAKDQAKVEPKPGIKLEPTATSDTPVVKPVVVATPATRRFRDSANVHIAAARERIAQRNLSGAMTMALAVGVLSAGVAGGAGYLAGLSEKSTTHAMALEQSVLRIEAEMLALRSEVERTARITSDSTGETSQRLERIEKAQAEPLAKLSKLAEMVEKLRSVQASTIAASKIDASDVTGSVSPQQGGKSRNSTAVVEAWVLREFDKDVALIEGKRGLLEIAVGDEIPGLGRVEGFRKHDGRWAVVTSKGLIVSR